MKKSKIAAVCATLAAGLMLGSCGIADTVTTVVTEIVQEATTFAFDEMGGGDIVTLATSGISDGEQLHVSLANNAVSIRLHADEMILVEFSPPTTGQYQVPTVEIAAGRVEITEPLNVNFAANTRPGMVYIYLPQTVVLDSMDLRAINGAIRIIGDFSRAADSIEITATNGMIDIHYFAASNISARTTNGTINASNLDTPTLALNTTNGVITLRNSEVSGDLTARTVNGTVLLENVDADMGRADVNAVNGTVTIR